MEAVERLLEYGADVLFCLNVWNWVPDKALLSRLIASTPEIVYEGHDSVVDETARLTAMGFDVDLVTMTERGRPVLHGKKRTDG